MLGHKTAVSRREAFTSQKTSGQQKFQLVVDDEQVRGSGTLSPLPLFSPADLSQPSGDELLKMSIG
jgi:hypothetical protein